VSNFRGALHLYHFDWRPYDPETARWLILDALADVRPEESPYSYTGNNPIVRIDPLGLYWVDTNGDGVADTWVVEKPIVVEVLPFYPTSDPGTDAIRSPMIEVDDLLGSKAIAKGLAKAGSIAITAAMIKKATKETVEKIPQKARNILKFIKTHRGTPPKGYKGGKIYENKTGKLPADGKYKEYDIDPKVRGVDRPSERIVIDENTGRAWYTPDHYESFVEIK